MTHNPNVADIFEAVAVYAAFAGVLITIVCATFAARRRAKVEAARIAAYLAPAAVAARKAEYDALTAEAEARAFAPFSTWNLTREQLVASRRVALARG